MLGIRYQACCVLGIRCITLDVPSKATAEPYTLPECMYIIICGMQCAVKKVLLRIKVGEQTLQGVQIEDLQTAYSYLVVWSAIMRLL